MAGDERPARPTTDRPARPTTAPPGRRKSALDDLRSMIEAGDAVILEASASQAKLQTVRKHSEGLGEELGAIISASTAWSLFGSRSGSKALTDAELRVAFDSIDTDSSGSIDAEELAVAIRAANSTLSNTTVAEMMSCADTDGDGRCAGWTHAEGRANPNRNPNPNPNRNPNPNPNPNQGGARVARPRAPPGCGSRCGSRCGWCGAHRKPRDGRYAVGRGELDQATVRHVVARAHVAQGEQHKARVAVHTCVAGAAAPG